MSDKFSYVKLEKDFSHELREHLNHSENTTDVSNCFSHIAGGFLRKAFDNEIGILDDDIIFTPDNEKKFHFSNRILKVRPFVDGISSSDMGNIISRFAVAAGHRYMHLEKHSEKSKLKIKAQKTVK